MTDKRKAPALAGAQGLMKCLSWRIDEDKTSKRPSRRQCPRDDFAVIIKPKDGSGVVIT